MDAMGWLAWLIVGGIAGALASAVMHSRLGIIGDIIVGIIGAFIGGFLFNLVGAPGATGFNIWSILVAFIGAVVLIFLVRAVSGATGSTAPRV
jgi:uncharacterized membrane protein YeaQ/YmgE (transglycosylase-associated protein family)